MNPVVAAIGRAGIVPVVTLDDARSAPPVVAALVAGGLPVVELTLRTPAGIDAIERAAAEVPDAVVGAGSVLSADAAMQAIDGGAQFVVSPGLAADVVEVAHRRGICAIPGVATATELLRAVDLGAAVAKLFPAELIGGRALVDALSAIWSDVVFVPTGGIDADRAVEYLAHDRVLAVGGSWMVRREWVAQGDWKSIESSAAACARLVESLR